MGYKYRGTVVNVAKVETFASGFKKRVFVLTDKSEKYPQEIPFEALKDNADRLDVVNVGDEIEVEFDLRGRAWEGKWFGSLAIWRFSVLNAATSPTEADFSPDDQILDEEPPF